MGERKGTNLYYPPDFDPKKHRNLAGYTGQHPLRERAKKIKQGILVIRFEMPYNIWCGGCGIHIAMGVRYNAEKSKIGNYYTTPIYKFRMKCHLCDNYFEIKTDPATHDYVIIEGARRKEQRWDPKENEQIVPEDKATQKKLALDAMYKLEHGASDKLTQKKAMPGIAQLEDRQMLYKDDYMLNKLLRTKFRGEKNALQKTAAADEDLLKRSSLDIELVKEDEKDKKIAGLIKYSTVKSYDEQQKEKREAIESRPIFGSPGTSSSPANNLVEVRKKVAAAAGKSRNGAFTSSIGKSGLTASSIGIVRKSQKDAINKKTVAETVSKPDQIETDNDSVNGQDLQEDKKVTNIVSCGPTNQHQIKRNLSAESTDMEADSTEKGEDDSTEVLEPKATTGESDKVVNTSLGVLGLAYDSSSGEGSSEGD